MSGWRWVQVNEEATDMCRRAGEQLHHFCTFVLPLPHEAADKIKTDKLTRAQLEQGLTHMMGKYRGAAEQNRRVPPLPPTPLIPKP